MDVLVVDDSEYLRELMCEVLKRDGYCSVREASNGEEAVELFREHRPSLVLMDVIMPIENGLIAMKKILEIDPDVVVILVTALAHKDLILRAISLGAHGHIAKPFSVAEFREKLSEFL